MAFARCEEMLMYFYFFSFSGIAASNFVLGERCAVICCGTQSLNT